MERISVLKRLVDALTVTRTSQHPSLTARAVPMSDGELARAMRELTLTKRSKRLKASAKAQTVAVRHSLEEDGHAIAQSQELIYKTVRILRDPAPDTFLGRKTCEPFPSEDDK